MNASYRANVEELEPRTVLDSFGLGAASVKFDALALLPSGDFREAARGGTGPGPAIRLDLVALHEFGHSLGLDHSDDPNSIMYAYYNPNYNLDNFAADSAVAEFQALFADSTTSPWKDSLDVNPGNGVVEITYSFIPDGTQLESGKKNINTLFASLNGLFGNESVWQAILVNQLERWASASNGNVTFVEVADAGLRFNYAGDAQNDSFSGDIRMGGHQFDGAGGVLAHAYFPPPNGYTAAGDVHFDVGENWNGLNAGDSGGPGGPPSKPGKNAALTFAASKLQFPATPTPSRGDNEANGFPASPTAPFAYFETLGVQESPEVFSFEKTDYVERELPALEWAWYFDSVEDDGDSSPFLIRSTSLPADEFAPFAERHFFSRRPGGSQPY